MEEKTDQSEVNKEAKELDTKIFLRACGNRGFHFHDT